LASLTLCSCLSTVSITRDTVEGELEKGFPVGWDQSGRSLDDYFVFIDRSIVHGGSASATLVALDVEWQGYCRFQQTIRADNYAGQRVRYRAFVRTNRVDDWCALWMRADSETHSGIAFDDMSARRIEGTTNWKSYDVVLDIPEDAKALAFGVVLHGIGQVWIDDCVLEVVGREVATTGEFNPRMKVNRRPIAPDLKLDPINLDFEGEVAEYLYDIEF
jgi:hypothetical protein